MMYTDYGADREERRRRFRRNLPWIAPLALAAVVGIFFGLGHLVRWLWLVTLVDIFGIKAISFWQAWGLILLSQILFKAHIQQTMRTGAQWRRHRAGGAPEAGQEGPR